MRLWNPSENMNISVYKGHTYPVWSVDVDRLGINVARKPRYTATDIVIKLKKQCEYAVAKA